MFSSAPPKAFRHAWSMLIVFLSALALLNHFPLLPLINPIARSIVNYVVSPIANSAASSIANSVVWSIVNSILGSIANTVAK